MEAQKHLQLLGMRVEDRVTKFRGVVTSVCFDLYGCIQATICPGLNKDNEPAKSAWFDVNRLKTLSTEPVMQRPDFVEGPVAEGKKGPADKPASDRW